jgi:2-keto-4-pentenoate hydratase/2-oxohepta-3-ene-1,7-dioic acid hydratase in catechol pathway
MPRLQRFIRGQEQRRVRLVTFRHGDSNDRVGAWIGDAGVLDLSEALQIPSMLALIEAGEPLWARARRAIEQAQTPQQLIAAERVVLRAPLPLPPQYRDSMSFFKHIEQAFPNAAILAAMRSGDEERIRAAREAKRTFALPDVYRRQPVYYKGNRFAVGHPGEDIVWPSYSEVMDFELELACVIGRRGRDIPRERALDHVFGFTILNDYSARDAQMAEMPGMLGPAKGKDFDKANVFGPCLVTLDEIGDPYALRMRARVNGELWCDSSSATMSWRFEDLIAHISRGETLHPGEIIGSGTVGDGCGLEHLRFLQAGDVVELEIEKIGRLSNRVVRA